MPRLERDSIGSPASSRRGTCTPNKMTLLSRKKRAMRSLCAFTYALTASFLAGSGSATVPGIAVPHVPARLRPPDGHRVCLEALASGVQIYESLPKPADPATYEWAFTGPDGAPA